MELIVAFYENWMKDQVVDMTCTQYGYEKSSYLLQFSNFYEPQFQNSAIKVVLLDGKKVTGFMGFFLWPYKFKGKIYKVYQAGNVIVDPSYRGQQIFHKMVEFMNKIHKEKGVDLLIGFPVDVAFNTYIRNGWENIISLNWYVKINNPFSIFFPLKKEKIKMMLYENKTRNLSNLNNHLYLDDSPEFLSWREGYYKSEKYYLTYSENKAIAQFGLKLNVRKKIIFELIIGEISTNNYTEVFLTNAIKHLLKKLKRIKAITIISFAANPYDKIFTSVMNNIRSMKIDKKIFFVAKNFSTEPELMNNINWSIFRGDIDSW